MPPIVGDPIFPLPLNLECDSSNFTHTCCHPDNLDREKRNKVARYTEIKVAHIVQEFRAEQVRFHAEMRADLEVNCFLLVMP